jgi:hypothetical protein
MIRTKKNAPDQRHDQTRKYIIIGTPTIVARAIEPQIKLYAFLFLDLIDESKKQRLPKKMHTEPYIKNENALSYDGCPYNLKLRIE